MSLSRQLDHPAGQMGDLHRFVHVEDEDLVARRHRSCFHYQPAGLRDRHEETGDIRMCNRHRAAFGDLLPEMRDHEAVRAQHVSEVCRHEFRLALHRTLLDRQPQRLYINFRKAFRTTHDICRVHGHVRQDHHHLFHIILDTLVRHVARSGKHSPAPLHRDSPPSAERACKWRHETPPADGRSGIRSPNAKGFARRR